MIYLLLKQFHMGLAFVSIAGFILRWAWQMRKAGIASHRVTRIAPHVVDTMLLIAGIMLAVMSSQYPWSHPWLFAKIGGLVVYIALGMAAMSLQNRAWQTVTFGLAVVIFAWIFSIARSKSPMGFLQAFL